MLSNPAVGDALHACCWRCSSCSFPVHMLRVVNSRLFLGFFFPSTCCAWIGAHLMEARVSCRCHSAAPRAAGTSSHMFVSLRLRACALARSCVRELFWLLPRKASAHPELFVSWVSPGVQVYILREAWRTAPCTCRCGRHSQLSVVRPCGKAVCSPRRVESGCAVLKHFLISSFMSVVLALVQSVKVMTSLFLHGFYRGFDLYG